MTILIQPRICSVISPLINLLVVFCTFISCNTLVLHAETIQLTNGKTIEGRVLSVEENAITIQWGDSKRIVPKSTIIHAAVGAFDEAQKALSKKDFIKTADLCQQILIWEPANKEVRAFHKKVHDDEVKHLIHQFHWSAPFVESLRRLKEIVTKDDLPAMHDTLKNHTNSRGRRAMGWILALIGSEESIDPLLAAMNGDEDGQTRRMSAYALGEIGSSRAQDDLIKAMQVDKDISVRMRSAEALNKIGSRNALAAIKKASIHETDSRVKLKLQYIAKNPKYDRHGKAPIHPGKITEGYCHGTCYLIYVPENYNNRKEFKLIVTVHGTDGGANDFVERCKGDAEKYGAIVLGPYFDFGQYPYYGELNIRWRKVRPDLVLLDIVDDLSTRLKFNKNRLLLFGHSEGGQFVHRFVTAHPDRVDRAAACGALNYVLPDDDKLFPWGLKTNPYAPDLENLDYAKLVQCPLAIVMGAKDSASHQESAERFMQAAHTYALKHNIPCNVKFIPVPDGGHASATNYPEAGKFLFTDEITKNSN